MQGTSPLPPGYALSISLFLKILSIGVETAGVIVNRPIPLSCLIVNFLCLLRSLSLQQAEESSGRLMHGLQTQEDLVSILALSLVICGVLGMSLNFSKAQFPHL